MKAWGEIAALLSAAALVAGLIVYLAVTYLSQ